MPKRHDDLFERIAAFPALIRAARRALRGKRRKPGAAAFMANLERECLVLERELRSGRWRPGRFVTFEVRDPKRRMISAAPFRDRVVHHALHTLVAPIFERGFIDDSYANREGKGTHRAIARYERLRDRHRHPRKTRIDPTARPAEFLGFELAPCGRRLPEANVRRFRNLLRGLRDRWRAGTVSRVDVERRIEAWQAHAAHAGTFRLQRAIFAGGWFDPARPGRSPVAAGGARRFLEQRTGEPPLGEPQQERARQPEQQPRFPGRQHAYGPERAGSRTRTACG